MDEMWNWQAIFIRQGGSATREGLRRHEFNLFISKYLSDAPGRAIEAALGWGEVAA